MWSLVDVLIIWITLMFWHEKRSFVFNFNFCFFKMQRRTLTIMINMTSSSQLRRRLRFMKVSIPNSIYQIATMNGVTSNTKTIDIYLHLSNLLLLRFLKPREWVNIIGKNMTQNGILFHRLSPTCRLFGILLILFKQL